MFTFDVTPEALFAERTRQFTALGIPRRSVTRVRRGVRDMWGMGEDGWVPVWAREAERAAGAGRPLLASLCWGAARFPALADAGRRFAFEQQLEWYLAAAPDFPVRFHRQVHDVPTPLHLFRRRVAPRPGVIVLSGGVDTWKMDLHRLAVATALGTGMLVVAMDMPGTGESPLPLTPAADRTYAEVVALLRRRYGTPVGLIGLSFGGLWAVKLALLGEVDAAVAIGAPTGASGEAGEVLRLPYGMAGIIGNALGLDALPSPAEAAALYRRFAVRELLDLPGSTPLLAVNGDHDQYVPLGDTTALAARPATTVWVIRGGTHCAPEHFPQLTLGMWGWLTARLHPGLAARPAEHLLRLPVRPVLTAA